MSSKLFEETAEETFVSAIVFFVIAVLFQVFGSFGLESIFLVIFLFGLVLAFIMGLNKKYEYLVGLLIGALVLSIMYYSINEDIEVLGVSFKDSISPMPVIFQIVFWIIGFIFSVWER